MKMLQHPNCIQLLESFYTEAEKPGDIYLNVVMDYIPETASTIIKSYRKEKKMVPHILVKLYGYQLMRAIAYIHAKGVCHRDIKPQNILINTETHQMKLCDFGSSKQLVVGEKNICYICSRYYRAPELLFGSTKYVNSIDVWSAGCVIAEYMLGQPLLVGDTAVEVLVEIIKILGTPTAE